MEISKKGQYYGEEKKSLRIAVFYVPNMSIWIKGRPGIIMKIRISCLCQAGICWISTKRKERTVHREVYYSTIGRTPI